MFYFLRHLRLGYEGVLFPRSREDLLFMCSSSNPDIDSGCPRDYGHDRVVPTESLADFLADFEVIWRGPP